MSATDNANRASVQAANAAEWLWHFAARYGERVLTYIVSVMFAFVVLLPFYWIFISSVTPKY